MSADCCLKCRKYFGYSHSYKFYKSLILYSFFLGGGWSTNDTVLIAVDNLLENPANCTTISTDSCMKGFVLSCASIFFFTVSNPYIFKLQKSHEGTFRPQGFTERGSKYHDQLPCMRDISFHCKQTFSDCAHHRFQKTT